MSKVITEAIAAIALCIAVVVGMGLGIMKSEIDQLKVEITQLQEQNTTLENQITELRELTITIRSETSTVIPDFEGRTLLVKCFACNASHDMSMHDYYQYQKDTADPKWMGPTPMFCEKCNERKVYKAVKCEKCSATFKEGSVPKGYIDTCPECGYSKMEEKRKERNLNQ